MKRIVIAVAAAALFACGGDEVKFDLDSPPGWLTNLDGALPAQILTRADLGDNCLDVQFAGSCEATVFTSKTLARKARFVLQQGSEVRITYVPSENANSVTITLRADKPATVPVRKSGGILEFRCMSVDRCVISLL